MDDNQIKDYLQRYEIKSEDGLANHILQLKTNTFPNIKLISELVWVLEDKESVFYSFLAENKNKTDYSPTPSKEFYNAFKQTTSSPTFMDEVLEQANKEKWNPLNELHERAGREMFNTIKDEDGQFNSTRHKSKEGETHTEIPNFNESVGFQMKRGRNIIYKPTQQSGVKETENKTDYSEIDFDILDLMAERFNANKHKYPKGNMLKPIDEKELLFAGFRHLKKMIQPIEGDEETFLQHLSSVLCNMQMVYQQLKLKKC